MQVHRHRLFSYGLAGLALLFAVAPATAQAGPGIIAKDGLDPVFNYDNFRALGLYTGTGTRTWNISQINMTKSSPHDTPGKWTVALTIYSLASAYGGGVPNVEFVIMGQYDTTGSKPTFTPGTLANNMNDTSKTPCSGLMIEGRDGLFAAVDWSDGPQLSWRPDNSSAFPAPVRITAASGATPLPSGGYVDPAPGYSDGKLKLFYTDKVNNILMQDIAPTIVNNVLRKAELQGTAVVVARRTDRPHSPTPIVDRTGEVRGLWMASNSGNDSDMYFMPSLNPADSPIRVFDNNFWMHNGGVAGGTLFFADTGINVYARQGKAAWLLGSNTPLGGVATMTLGCHSPRGMPVASHVALSLEVNNGTKNPVTIPGWNGAYALSGSILVFTRVVGTGPDELAHWSETVPNQQSLKGRRLAIQGLAMPQGANPTLTNTATLEFR